MVLKKCYSLAGIGILVKYNLKNDYIIKIYINIKTFYHFLKIFEDNQNEFKTK